MTANEIVKKMLKVDILAGAMILESIKDTIEHVKEHKEDLLADEIKLEKEGKLLLIPQSHQIMVIEKIAKVLEDEG